MIRATWGRSMDGEDLIICVARLVVQKLCAPLISDDSGVISIASRNKLRFTSLLGPIFEDFGGPTGPENSMFELFFSMLFRNAFSYRILIDFWRLRTAKIAILLKENNDFCKIGVFDKGKKQIGFGVPFGRPNQRKFDRKLFPKNVFLTSIFMPFVFDFGSIFGTKNR